MVKELDYNKILSDFVRKQRNKVFAFLRKSYHFEDCDNYSIFQDSLIILWEKLQKVDEEGIKNMTSTSTYFLAICKNKAREFLREHPNTFLNIDDDDINQIKVFKQENVDFLLTFDNGNDIIKREKEDKLHRIIKDLPQPCEDLLWGFYRDELSLKELSEKFNYKSEGTVKVTKHRCLQKLITKYKEI